MSDLDTNKQAIRQFIQTVWVERNLSALSDFWTDDCINHAMPRSANRGLAVLQAYHEQFFNDFSAFSNIKIAVIQQVSEVDRVVTQLITQGTHSAAFFGIQPTEKHVSLATIRIDRMSEGKIAEHWSVADVAGLLQQLQS